MSEDLKHCDTCHKWKHLDAMHDSQECLKCKLSESESEKSHYLDRLQKRVKECDQLQTKLSEQSAKVEDLESKQYEILGWVHAYFCTELDDGNDPRKVDIPDLMKKAIKQLDLKSSNR